MDASNSEVNGLAKEVEDELMKFTTKREGDVNITECTKSLGSDEMVGAKHGDTTESSSSFDGSDYGVESDSEVTSDFHGDAGFGEKFRKRKLTSHWRSFIQPLMWRCKWAELQMIKLQSQARKYDTEIEACTKLKQTDLEDSMLMDGVRSLPFEQLINSRSQIIKRKKRRLTEVTTDVEEYMSNHTLFSCHENAKITEGAFRSNKLKNPGKVNQTVIIDEEVWGKNEPGDDDDSFEHMLVKIDLLQSQIAKMKSRVDSVKRENAKTFSWVDSLSLSMQSNGSPESSGDRTAMGTYMVSQLMSEYNSMPESAVGSHGDVPNRNVEDGILIDNERVKEEMNNYKEVKILPVQKPLVLKVEQSENTAPTEPDVPTPPKMRSISKINATKGKKRKWRRRVTGRRS